VTNGTLPEMEAEWRGLMKRYAVSPLPIPRRSATGLDGTAARFLSKPTTCSPPVYGSFTEGFDTLDLKEARALLNELTA
jgi:hypothetical protein